MYEGVIKQNNGAIRINFLKDFTFENNYNNQRIEEILKQLKTKGDICRKIYKFEKQVFITKGKIIGNIPQT